MKKITLALTIVLLFLNTAPIMAISQDYDVSKTIEYIVSTVTNPEVNSIGGEWAVISVAKSNSDYDSWFEKYKNNLKEYIASKGSNVLNSRKSTDNARVVLALSSLGIDASCFEGYDLVSPLLDINYVSKQGINGVIYALIAIDSYGFTLDSNPREDYISYLESKQLDDGGWALSGMTADADITAMALQALAPYYNIDSVATKLVNDGLNCLTGLQQEDGMFSSWGTVNSESCSQVLLALSSLDIRDDERFIKNGKSLVDVLLCFYDETTHGFAHELGGEVNQMATEQAALALVTYYSNSNKSIDDDEHNPIDLFVYFEGTNIERSQTLDLYYIDDWKLDSVLDAIDISKLGILFKNNKFYYNGSVVKCDIYLDGELINDDYASIQIRQSQSIKIVIDEANAPMLKFSFDAFMLPSKVRMFNK